MKDKETLLEELSVAFYKLLKRNEELKRALIALKGKKNKAMRINHE